MIYREIQLSEKYPDATLTEYLCDNAAELKAVPREAVIVCPGGAYEDLSDREAEPIAANYFAAGMNTYILRYSVKEGAANYRPLIEAALAIKYVREHAEEENTDPSKIMICGFSAGGHLAASAGIYWDLPLVRDAVGVTDGSAKEGINRPDGLILCYPVITTGKFTHVHSTKRLTGKENYTEEDAEPFSMEKHVSDTTPPVFLFHTFDDKVVPVQNSLMLLEQLAAHKIPTEAHIYPKGPHGMALANKQTWINNPAYLDSRVAEWVSLSVSWIHSQF